MSRKPRIDISGYYQVINTLLKDDKIIFHAFCLMNNHYHLLLENSLQNLSHGMKYLNGEYAVVFIPAPSKYLKF